MTAKKRCARPSVHSFAHVLWGKAAGCGARPGGRQLLRANVCGRLLNSAKYLPGETSADDALMTGKWLLFFRSTKTKPRRTAALCQLRHFASQQIIVIRSLRDPPAGQHVRGRAHAPARGANGQIDVAGTSRQSLRWSKAGCASTRKPPLARAVALRCNWAQGGLANRAFYGSSFWRSQCRRIGPVWSRRAQGD